MLQKDRMGSHVPYKRYDPYSREPRAEQVDYGRKCGKAGGCHCEPSGAVVDQLRKGGPVSALASTTIIEIGIGIESPYVQITVRFDSDPDPEEENLLKKQAFTGCYHEATMPFPRLAWP